jgi:hypothetical protein
MIEDIQNPQLTLFQNDMTLSQVAIMESQMVLSILINLENHHNKS